MKERIKKILREETSDQTDIIKQILDHTIVSEHGDIICNIEVIPPSTYRLLYEIIVTFKIERNTDTISLRDIYDDIITKAWEAIYNYTGMNVQVYYRFKLNCE